jgi:hypothetical protein
LNPPNRSNRLLRRRHHHARFSCGFAGGPAPRRDGCPARARRQAPDPVHAQSCRDPGPYRPAVCGQRLLWRSGSRVRAIDRSAGGTPQPQRPRSRFARRRRGPPRVVVDRATCRGISAPRWESTGDDERASAGSPRLFVIRQCGTSTRQCATDFDARHCLLGYGSRRPDGDQGGHGTGKFISASVVLSGSSAAGPPDMRWFYRRRVEATRRPRSGASAQAGPPSAAAPPCALSIGGRPSRGGHARWCTARTRRPACWCSARSSSACNSPSPSIPCAPDQQQGLYREVRQQAFGHRRRLEPDRPSGRTERPPAGGFHLVPQARPTGLLVEILRHLQMLPQMGQRLGGECLEIDIVSAFCIAFEQ